MRPGKMKKKLMYSKKCKNEKKNEPPIPAIERDNKPLPRNN
jgi:hypothetical protein